MAIDQNLQLFDIRDSYTLTRMIERRKPEQTIYQVPFAPMRPHNSRQVRLFIKRYNGSGLSQFRAANANTPIMPNTGSAQEQKIDLVNLAELAPVREDELLDLNSVDSRVRYSAIQTVLERTERLRLRNVNRTIWMAWQAVKDELVITYPDGGSITVDWDLDKTGYNSWFTATHLPSASTDWNHQDASGNYDATIITDIETWADTLAIDGGVIEEQIIMHVNSRTWRIIQENQWLRNQFSTDSPRDIRPKRSEAAEALSIGAVNIVDSYYWDEDSNVRYKHLDDGKALFTGPYIAPDGAPIVEMLDGPIVKVQNGMAMVDNNPGLQAEMWAREDPPQQFVRVQSARMPILNHPEMILYATLWS